MPPSALGRHNDAFLCVRSRLRHSRRRLLQPFASGQKEQLKGRRRPRHGRRARTVPHRRLLRARARLHRIEAVGASHVNRRRMRRRLLHERRGGERPEPFRARHRHVQARDGGGREVRAQARSRLRRQSALRYSVDHRYARRRQVRGRGAVDVRAVRLRRVRTSYARAAYS